MNDTTYLKTGKTYSPATVLQIPINDEDERYVVQMKDLGEIREVMSSEMYDHDPTVIPTDNPSKPFLPVDEVYIYALLPKAVQ